MGKKEDKIYSCGVCGAPCTENGDALSIPKNYDPDDYSHTYCCQCQYEEEENQKQYVTREMALDAGDPSLEGEPF